MRTLRNQSDYTFNYLDTPALYNTKIKIYPDNSTSTVYCDRPIFRDPYALKRQKDLPCIPKNPDECFLPPPDPNADYYLDRFRKQHPKKNHPKESEEDMIYKQSMKRAKDKIFDITMCNKWDYFFTGTFDDSRVGENTTENLLTPVQDWLKNQTRRKGLAYVLVAEYSPLNHRIHFHGLLNSALDMTDSGRRLYNGKSYKISTVKRKKIAPEQYKVIYDITAWSARFGYTTAIPVTGDIQLARYITKYITKDTAKIFGKYFWSSRNIVREPQIRLCNTEDFDSIAQPEHLIEGCNFRLKYDSDFKY